MKLIGILLSLIVSAFIIYLTFNTYLKSNSSNPSDPLGLIRPIEKAKNVQSAVNLSAVQTAVQNYQIQQGAFPQSLKDLVSAGLVTESQINNLDYDPASGKVSPRSE